MYQESHAFSKEKYEGLIQSKIHSGCERSANFWKMNNLEDLLNTDLSIADLQQTLKYVSFTKIQHRLLKDERFTKTE